MKRYLLILFFISSIASGQGFNHQWLLGSYNFFQDPKGRMLFDSSNYSLLNENRKMIFKGTQGNISDANGNFLMSTNGGWIANANNDTMMNGSGLNPNSVTTSWPFGQVITYGNIILPFPGDSSKYVLVHQTGDSLNQVPSTELYLSLIDMSFDGGLGGIDSSQKNIILFHDTISWGISASKHANGRDWWIITMKDSSALAIKLLLTPSGITNISYQNLNYFPFTRGTSSQLTFAQNGKKFCLSTYDDPLTRNSSLVIGDFDRCTGVFSNTQTISLTNNAYLWGIAFSSNSNLLYGCSSDYVFQIDVNTLTVDTVAAYDGFLSPGPTCCSTSFWNMYLAANGKIYISSGSGVQHLHEMNYPDSAGIACDVQQHIISLGYAQLRSVPNHPNYYLSCDTTSSCPCLTTSINQQQQHDFKFSISPNPSSGNFKIIYLLLQNKQGRLDVFDITGKTIYTQTLPPWSTMQTITLPQIAAGLYNCVITSGEKRVSGKLAVKNP